MACALALLSMVGLAASLAAPARAQTAYGDVAYESDPNAPLLPVRLDGHASLTWDGFFGVGARVDIPIMKGLSYSSRDEFAISAGADVIFVAFEGSHPLEVWPTAVVQWSLGVSDKFSFYPELGIAAKVTGKVANRWQGVFPNVGFGGRYTLYRSVALTGRLGWPMAISLGATF
jgi:hypothetical protein